MKAVAYLRVSTEEQDLNRQYVDIKSFALSKNLELIEIFEDKISGSKTKATDRVGFNSMNEYLEKNTEVKNLLVIEVSRLGRRNLDILTNIEKFYEKGINVHLKDLNISTLDSSGNKAPITNMVISLLGSMAENETRLLSERIKSGKLQRAREGLTFSSKITGYKKNSEGKPIIDKKEAQIVKRVFELASDSIGMRSITDVIMDEFGRDMQMGTISGILRNPFYKGERKYSNENILVDAIVSKDLWEKANDSVNSRKHFVSRKYVHTNLVQGRIKCNECNNVMHQVVIEKSRANQFRCKNLSCGNSINRPWLYEAIRQIVERHAQKAKEEDIRKEIIKEIDLLETRIRNYDRELSKSKAARTRIVVLFSKGDIEKEDFDTGIAELKDNISKLSKDIVQTTEMKNSYEISLNNKIEHFSNDLKVLKKQINDILKSVRVSKNEVEINLSFLTVNLPKPNSGKLGWLTRKAMSNNVNLYGDILESGYLITAEELEQIDIMVNSMSVTEDEIDKYFESDEYKKKIANRQLD